MKLTLIGCLLFLSFLVNGQIDDSLLSISQNSFPHYLDAVPESENTGFDGIKQKGEKKVLLLKTLYIEKYQGTWMYDADSCSLKRIKAQKMAYFSTGTKAIYFGLSFNAGIKERKFFRGVSYRILKDMAIGDTLRFTLTTLADKDSKFQPLLYGSDKIKIRRGRLKNGKYLTFLDTIPKPSLNDQQLVQNHLEIPITTENKNMKWIHVINNEDEMEKGFIIENDHSIGGSIDDEYERVYFRNDSYDLTQKSRELLDEIVSKLKNSNAIVLRGYADPTGQKEYNIKLAKKRAISVMEYFISHGVDPSRVHIEEYDIGKHQLAKENRICTILVL